MASTGQTVADHTVLFAIGTEETSIELSIHLTLNWRLSESQALRPVSSTRLEMPRSWGRLFVARYGKSSILVHWLRLPQTSSRVQLGLDPLQRHPLATLVASSKSRASMGQPQVAGLRLLVSVSSQRGARRIRLSKSPSNGFAFTSAERVPSRRYWNWFDVVLAAAGIRGQTWHTRFHRPCFTLLGSAAFSLQAAKTNKHAQIATMFVEGQGGSVGSRT